MSEDKLDRFARGELSAMESRELAQKSLDDAELFEDLTAASLARTVLVPRPRKRPLWLAFAGMAAALAIVLLSSSLLRRSLHHSAAVRTPAPAPAAPVPPVFLARAGGPDTSVFRGEEAGSRAPRLLGSITAIADGAATVDVGSLDGLSKGAELEVLREGNVAGHLHVTTVFRQRARADVPAGLALRVNDQVRVPPALYLRGALDEIAALSAGGDQEGARRIAGEAAAAGDAAVTAASYEDANNLAGIAALHGDRAKAQALYEQALRAGPPPDARQAIEANLQRVRQAR